MNKTSKKFSILIQQKPKKELLSLRKLILEVAEKTTGVGKLEECLKWGEPSYLTSESKSGSTIRIHWKASHPNEYGMYFNCNTSLVDTFRALFPNDFKFEGNRAVLFHLGEKADKKKLSHCIELALTYHLNKAK